MMEKIVILSDLEVPSSSWGYPLDRWMISFMEDLPEVDEDWGKPSRRNGNLQFGDRREEENSDERKIMLIYD